MGCDVVDKVKGELPLTLGRIEALPFPDRCFDVVTCSHTLEHIIDPSDAIRELERVAKRLLFIVVPCQRYYYTLDEHVNFYPQKEILESQIGLPGASCEKLHGDWFFKGGLRPSTHC